MAHANGAQPIADVAPLLLLDVDGVLQPVGNSIPPGYERHVTDTSVVVLNAQHGAWLRGLASRFRIVWATTWGSSANELIGQRLGLPTFPNVELRALLSRQGTRKLSAVQSFVGDQPCAWIDDELYEDAFEWASERRAPTLLIRTSAYVGLVHADVEALDDFATGVARG